MMKQEIENIRIVKIIDQFKVVINKGRKDGITDYMTFLIYENGDKIIDPLTNKDLGTLEITKGKAVPVHIQDHMTTLESDEYEVEKSQKMLSLMEFIERRKKKPFKNVQQNDFVKII